MLLKIKRKFKFKIPSQEASIRLSFLIPTLSPYINKKKIEIFCEKFNNLTIIVKKGIEVPANVDLYEDGTTEIYLKSLAVNFLIKKINLFPILDSFKINVKVNVKTLYQIVWYKIRFLEVKHNYKKNSLTMLEKKLFLSILYGLKSSGVIVQFK